MLPTGCICPPPPRPGTSTKKPFPEWVQYKPNQIWIYDTTHFPRAKVAVTVVEDLVRRMWLADIVSAEEISYVTPDDEHEGRGTAIRKAREAGLEAARLLRLAYHRSSQPTNKPETR